MKKQKADTTPADPTPATLDRSVATPVDPARTHRPTGRTVAWIQDGHFYSATGVPIAPENENELEPPEGQRA